MAVRRESVQLDVTGNFRTEMAANAASVALLSRQVDQLNRQRINLSVDNSEITRAIAQAEALRIELERVSRINANPSVNTRTSSSGGSAGGGLGGMRRDADGASNSINQLTGRLGLFADAALILGPGLVPIGAAGVQALGGLTAAATAAATAGASAVVAFQGLGDAVKAVNEFQDDKTFANLEKAREAMNKLGPDAQRFVMEFQKFRPVLSEIKRSAEAGWFPGLTESLDGFAKLGPKIEDIFFKAGEAGGFLVDSAADSLSSDRWAPFLEFIEREVPTAMGSLAQIMGDLGHGAAEMFMAFDPGNDSFLAWLEDVADGFDKWASSSQGKDAIADILDYARQNGPALQDLFTSLVGTLAALVKAAAPIGGAVLPALTAVSDAVQVIADSDMATPIIAAIAAMRIYSRIAAVAATAQTRLVASQTASAGALSAANRAALNSNGLTGTALGAALAAPRGGVAAQQRAQRAANIRAGAQGAAGLGAIALASSGLTDGMEGANTASMALLGTMIAPGWGTAAGAIVGGFMDIAGANDSLVESFEKTGAALNSGDFALSSQGLAASMKELDAYKKDLGSVGWSPVDQGQSLLSLGKGIFGDTDIQKAEKQYADLENQQRANSEAAASLGEALGMTIGPVDGSTRSINELEAAMEAAKPAMDALSISQADFLVAAQQQAAIGRGGMTGAALAAALGTDVPLDEMNDRIAERNELMDTAQGRAENYTAQLGKMVRGEGTAAEQAQGLNDALSAMIDPANNAEAALDNYRQTLKNIRELDSNGGFTAKNEVGRTNRAETRAYADAVKDRLVTMVAAGRTEEQVGKALARSRVEFIKNGVAAGFSAKEMKRRADTIGLTPKLVTTTFRALGIGAFERQVEGIRDLTEGVPKRVLTDIATNGIPQTAADIEKLLGKYKLTEKQRTAVLALIDRASGQIPAAIAALDKYNGRTATSYIYIRTIRTDSGATGGGSMQRGAQSADGSTVPKTGLPYADRHPYLLADGEEVISNRYGQADRNRALLKAINSNRLADGGTAWGGGSSARPRAGEPWGGEAREAARSLKEFRRQLKESTAALEKEKQQRQDMRSYRSEVGGSLAGDLTGNGLAGLDTGLAANRNDARAMIKALIQAKKKGLDGPLFDLVAASGDLNLAQQLAELSRAGIRRREELFGATQRSERQLGTFAAEEKFNETFAHNTKVIDRLEKQVKRLDKAVENGARRGTREGAKGSNRRTSTGSRAGRG